MNNEQMINSIYNPKRKPRQPFAFPKINKAEATPPENKVFVRGASRKYNQQNIFKIEDEKKQRVKMHIEQERLKQLRQREYEELQMRMAALIRRHQEEMRELEQQEKNISTQIDQAKKAQYQSKYSIWELKNEIMNLNAAYLEHQNQYQRLYQEVGYVEDGLEGQEGEGEPEVEGEGEGEDLEEGPEEDNHEELQGQGQGQQQGLAVQNRSVTVQQQREEDFNRLQQQTHSLV